MKFFVTGVGGQLGHDVMNELIRRGHEGVGSDIQEQYSGVEDGSEVTKAPYLSLDITDKEAVKRVIESVKPDAVIHCAAWTAVDMAEDDDKIAKVRAINAGGTQNIADVCKKLDCKMTYISTDYVFDGQGTEPWKPDCKDYKPMNVYGQTKLEGELAVSQTLEKYFIVRIAWVFGLNGKNFIKTMLNVGKTHDTVRVVNDQIGTPTYTYDLARLLIDMNETEKYGYYHATNEGGYISWYDFTREIYRQAAHDLGMGTTYLDPSGSQIGKKESIRDTARVLGRMFEGIEYRGFGQEIVEELARYAGVPVWNGLTNEYHPTQMLADMLTIREHLGHLKGVKLVYMGDARYNMGNSLMIACAKLGMHFVACAPEKYFPNAALVEECQDYAKESGGSITLTEDVKVGTKDADVIYTDVWVSMGEPDEVWEERIRELTPYKVTKEVMENAGEKAIFLHCLPAFHDWETKIGKEMGERFNLKEMEVTDEVFESEQSVVFDEAENRMHTIKAVMAATLGA